MPEAQIFYLGLPSIHAPNFLEYLYDILQFVNKPSSGVTQISVIVEARLEGNRYKTVAPSFRIGPNFTLNELSNILLERIENFEAQSGTGEEGPSVIDCRALITNISSAPNPTAQPFSSDPNNLQWKKDAKVNRTATRRPSVTLQSLNNLNSNMDSKFSSLTSSMDQGFDKVVQAIRSQPSSSATPIPLLPIIDGIAQVLGYSKSNTISSTTPSEVQKAPREDLTTLHSRLDSLEQSFSSLSSTVTQLSSDLKNQIAKVNSTVDSLAHTVDSLAHNTNSQINQMSSAITQLTNLMSIQINKEEKGTNGSSSNGSSLPPSGTSTTNGNPTPSGVPNSFSSFFAKMANPHPDAIIPKAPNLSNNISTQEQLMNALDKRINSTKSNRMEFGPKLPYLYELAIEQGKRVAEYPSVHMIAVELPEPVKEGDGLFTQDVIFSQDSMLFSILKDPTIVIIVYSPSLLTLCYSS